MRRTVLVVVLVLLAVYALSRYTLNGSSIPASANGGEIAAGASADAGIARMIPVLMETSPPIVETPAPVPAPIVPMPAAAPIPVVAVGPAETGTEQEELRAIDVYAEQERQGIEVWYSDQLAGLKVQLEQKLEKLDGIDKLAWARFHQRANETWSMTDGYESGSSHDYGYGFTHGRSSYSGITTTHVRGDPAGEYAAILARIKDSKQVTQQDFSKAQESLIMTKRQKLDAVQAEVDGRKTAIATRRTMVAMQRSRAQTEAARKLSGDLTPIVEAVVAGAGNRLCALVDGALVSEGDVVQGYRIRKISAGMVEFGKDGKTWAQKVD